MRIAYPQVKEYASIGYKIMENVVSEEELLYVCVSCFNVIEIKSAAVVLTTPSRVNAMHSLTEGEND